jgi:hypothetical protein
VAVASVSDEGVDGGASVDDEIGASVAGVAEESVSDEGVDGGASVDDEVDTVGEGVDGGGSADDEVDNVGAGVDHQLVCVVSPLACISSSVNGTGQSGSCLSPPSFAAVPLKASLFFSNFMDLTGGLLSSS